MSIFSISRPLRIEYPSRAGTKGGRLVYGKGVEDLRASRRGGGNEGRKGAMVLMKTLCDMTLVEVAREFRVKSYGTVG